MLDPVDVCEPLLSAMVEGVKVAVEVTVTCMVLPSEVVKKAVVNVELTGVREGVVVDVVEIGVVVVGGAVVAAVVVLSVVDVGVVVVVGVVCVVVGVAVVVGVVVVVGVLVVSVDVGVGSGVEVDSGTAAVATVSVAVLGGDAVVGVLDGSNVVVESTLIVSVLVELEVDIVNCLATFHLVKCLGEEGMLAGRTRRENKKLSEKSTTTAHGLWRR